MAVTATWARNGTKMELTLDDGAGTVLVADWESHEGDDFLSLGWDCLFEAKECAAGRTEE